MGKPGVMIYFDIIPAIQMLSNDECGELFKTILQYSSFGECAEPSNRVKLAWAFMKPLIDRDNQKYIDVSIQNKYKVYKRECKRRNVAPLDLEEWISTDNQKLSSDINRYPTTTPTTTTIPTTTSTIKEKTNNKFSSPSIEQIQQYAAENNLPDCAEDFFLYYDSNGWMVGKNKMKSWKSAYSRWVKQNKKDVKNIVTGKNGNTEPIFFKGITRL